MGTPSRIKASATTWRARASHTISSGYFTDPPIFPATFDALVAILVKIHKVHPHLLFPLFHNVAHLVRFKTLFEVAYSLNVKLVLMGLEIAQLAESLHAVVQFACERLGGRVHNLVGANIAML